MEFQTSKFILKCDVKDKKWYLALVNKQNADTKIEFYKSKKKAMDAFNRMIELPKQPENVKEITPLEN